MLDDSAIDDSGIEKDPLLRTLRDEEAKVDILGAKVLDEISLLV